MTGNLPDGSGNYLTVLGEVPTWFQVTSWFSVSHARGSISPVGRDGCGSRPKCPCPPFPGEEAVWPPPRAPVWPADRRTSGCGSLPHGIC